MPFLFIGTGIVFVLTGLKGDAGKLYDLVKGDFIGPNNYIYWLLSILILGSLGYIPQLRNLSKVFVALVIVVLFLDNRGFFAKLQQFINSSQNPAASEGAAK